MLSNAFKHSHRVTYSDCTVGNHVYYGRYFDILEEARGEFFRSLGLTFESLSGRNYIFPVIEAGLKYRSPARYDDVLEVTLWISQLTAVRIAFGCRVTRAAELVVEGTTLHVCTSLQDRPTRIPPDLALLLKPFVVSDRVDSGGESSGRPG